MNWNRVKRLLYAIFLEPIGHLHTEDGKCLTFKRCPDERWP